MPDTPLVSIIIVNFKDYSYLRRCLVSLKKTTYPNIEIIVVDNESDNKALSKIRDEFGINNVRFFPQDKNLNYAGGNNFGITRSRGEYIVLLNNDTEVEGGWLEPLIREAQTNPKAFYQPKILLLDKPDHIFSLGCTVHLFGIAYPLGIGKKIKEVDLPNHKVEVFYCVGACIFTTRIVLEEIKGLDSNYWTYYEDVNLGWRGKLQGYPSFLVPDSTIYHKWGGTYGQELSAKKLRFLERGRLSSIIRNYSIRTMVIILPAIIFLELGIFLYLLPKGLASAKIRASLDVFMNLRYIIRERMVIQKSRLKNDMEISKCMNLKIEHPLIGKISPRVERMLINLSKRLMNML